MSRSGRSQPLPSTGRVLIFLVAPQSTNRDRGVALRIAQVSPLIESVPPRQYGGTERVVAFLTDELVAAGHEVTLFASGDSRTRARLVPCAPRALRLDPRCVDPMAHQIRMVEEGRPPAANLNFVHFHID